MKKGFKMGEFYDYSSKKSFHPSFDPPKSLVALIVKVKNRAR